MLKPSYEKYARLRDARELNDHQVSKQIGIASATLTEWKKGSYSPKTDKMLRICNLFNVPLEFLMEEQEV